MADPLTGLTPGSIDSEYAGLLAIYYRRAILAGMFKAFGLWNLMDVEAFPQRTGYTGTFFRYPDIQSLAASGASNAETIGVAASTDGEHPAATTVKTAQWTVTLKGLGGWVNPAEIAQLTTIDGLKELPNKVRQWAEETMDEYLQQKVAPNLLTVRPDASASYELDFAATSAGTTTTIVSTSLNGLGDNFCANSSVFCIDPESQNFGLARKVTSFADTGDTITCAAFPYATYSGEKFRISDPEGLDDASASDAFDVTQLRYCAKHMRKNGAYGPGIEIPGGGYNLVYDGEFEYQLGEDSKLQTMWQYKDSERGLRTYKPGMIAMMRPNLTYRLHRFADTDLSTYSRTALVGAALIFGKGAMCRMPLERNDLKIIFKPKSSGGTSNPLELYETLGWKIYQATVIKDCTRGCAAIAYHP